MKHLGGAGVLEEIEIRLRRVRADDRPRWGTMSALQMVSHLGFATETALGDRTVTPVPGIPPALMKFAALRIPTPWPRGVNTAPEMKQAIVDLDPNGSFDEAATLAIARLRELAQGARCAASHPMFGAMKHADWLRWGYLHTDHHLRQFGR